MISILRHDNCCILINPGKIHPGRGFFEVSVLNRKEFSVGISSGSLRGNFLPEQERG